MSVLEKSARAAGARREVLRPDAAPEPTADESREETARMIQKLTHTTIYVTDQERAKAFYTEKLGFELRSEQKMGNFRWLTVSPQGEPEHEIVLMSVSQAPNLNEEQRASLGRLVESGHMGACVFGTKDCRKTYEELKARGVHFRSEPEERFYGVEAMFQDDSGNLFSLTERRK
jgi:catechol 2,3-dioxygenase-like lactoylglutathione lyase family enzyme